MATGRRAVAGRDIARGVSDAVVSTVRGAGFYSQWKAGQAVGWIALGRDAELQCRSLALMIDDWYKSTDASACVSIDHAIASFAMQRIAR
jgi:hypothetical protein